MKGNDNDVRVDGFSIAKYIKGKAAINGIKALYRHFKSIQSSNNPIKPPNKMHAAKVNGAETRGLGDSIKPKKYTEKR